MIPPIDFNTLLRADMNALLRFARWLEVDVSRIERKQKDDAHRILAMLIARALKHGPGR